LVFCSVEGGNAVVERFESDISTLSKGHLRQYNYRTQEHI
jgi:hypothetical protein